MLCRINSLREESMAKSKRVLLLMVALGLLVAIIGVVHAVNEPHVNMAESPQSQSYEISTHSR